MPTNIRELGIQEEEIEKLAEMCSFGKTRVISGYKPLEYEDMLAIFRMAYGAD